MKLDARAIAFLEKNHAAAMTTLRRDGTPHSVRIGAALVDGRIWSSSTPERVRTRHVRRDPRATLFVFDNAWAYLAAECIVTILEGPDVPDQSVRLFQLMQQGMAAAGKVLWYGAEKTADEFKDIMRQERRIIYEFTPQRVYGMYGEMPGR